jgi:hypothetical protein
MSDVNSTIISGIVAAVGPVETVGAKAHKKQIVAVTTDGQYPQTIGVEFFGKNQPLVDNLDIREGDRIRCHCNINGREHNGRYYVTLSAWKAEADAGTAAAPPPTTQRRDRGAPPPPANPDDDLPFATCSIGAEPSPIWRPFR